MKTKGSGLPSRVILHGVEGIGKTSFAANAPSPIFVMARGETGLETLIDQRQLPDVPHVPETMTWQDLLGVIESLTNEPHEYKTLVLDTLNGLERLCHEFTCARDFGGDWGNTGFASYSKGYDVSLTPWREFLNALDRLREQKKMAIICLCHTKIKTFKNPLGNDFDRYQPAVHEKTWELTHRWADIVLFANYLTLAEKDRNELKAKGKGGQQRVLYTIRHAAYDAKNRAGLPEEIDMGDSGKDAWGNFVSAIRSARTPE